MAAENNDDTVKFEIGSETFTYPDPFDLDLDEWVVVYEIAGVVLEDIAPLADKTAERERVKKLRNPAMLKALAVVSYMRAKPDADIEEVRELIGGAKMLGLLESMAPSGDEEDPTRASQTPTDEPSPSSEDDSNAEQSNDSPKNSATPEGHHAIISTGG